MKLGSAPKISRSGVHRIERAEDTLRRVSPVAARIGITRLADITGLDRIGIPVYSAIVPKSNDVVSVYNGKGVSRTEAKVGAIMEAIERYAAWNGRRPDVVGSYDALSADQKVLDPHDIVVEIQDGYSNATEIAWIKGYDLMADEAILVPYYAAAYFNRSGDDIHLCYAVTSTNGLASGNSLEEAICHALCEIIERDAWTLAELLSRSLPSYLAKRYPDLGQFFSEDDLERFPSIDPHSVSGPPRELIDAYEAAGIDLLLRNVTADNGIATIICTISENVHPSFSGTHAGVGTHPDSTVALTRALTEAAQARAVDIQGLREDISMADDIVENAFLHSKRVARTEGPGFYQTGSRRPIAFADVPTYCHADILDDIGLMLDRLRRCGLKRAIMVDFSDSAPEAFVARVIVPQMESWAAVKGKIGRRASSLMSKVAGERRTAAILKANSRSVSDALFGRFPRSEP